MCLLCSLHGLWPTVNGTYGFLSKMAFLFYRLEVETV